MDAAAALLRLCCFVKLAFAHFIGTAAVIERQSIRLPGGAEWGQQAAAGLMGRDQ
jgi:hypothetical protein